MGSSLLICFRWLQGNHLKIFIPRITKYHWGYPSNFVYCLQGNHLKIESDQGAIRPIWFIPRIVFDWLQVNNLNRVVPRGTKLHWDYISQLFNWLQVNNIKRVNPRGTKANLVCTSQFFDWLQDNNLKRVGQRVTESHWVNSLKFLKINTRCLHIHWKSIDLSSSDITTYF